MKQKLLTLMTLLLCAVSGAWATTTTVSLVSYTVTDNKATIKNEDVTVVLTRTSGTLPGPASSSRGLRWQTKCVVTATIPSGNIIKSVKLTCGKNGNSVGSITYTLTDGTSAITGTWDNDLNGSKQDDYTWTAGGSTKTNNWVLTNTGSTGDLYISAVTVEYVADKTIATQTLGGVRKGSTKLTEGTDYTISSTTITLAEAYKAATAPTDVKLINQITYTDSSEEEQDVEVTLAKNGDYFEGSEFIGLTEYTVKVPVDATPTLTLSAAAGEIALKSFEPTGSVKVTVTGANLTGDTFSAPTVEGVTIAPATATITDGAFSQEFTITSTATTAASTVIGFAHTGATTQNYTLTYSKTAQRSLAQADVTATTTWDWTKAGTNEVKLTDATSPSKSDEFVMSDIAEIDNDAEFNSQALKCRAVEYLVRDTKYLQGTEISFKTTKPGTVQVWFSNTGGSRPYRYLYVNGLTEYKSNSSASAIGSAVASGEITVPAGNIVIKGVLDPDASTNFDGYNEGSHGAEGSDQFLRIFKVIFTANDAIEQDAIEVPCPGGLGTFYDGSNDLDFSSSSAQAYIVTAVTASAVTLTEVKKVPAGYGVIVKGASQGETVNVLTTTMTSDEITAFEALGNKLYAGPWTVSSDGEYWALSKTDGKFHPLKAGVTIPAGKAYLPGSEVPTGANFLSLDFGEGEGDVTGIEAVKSHKVVNNNVFYNLAGQQVAQPAKGLYIVNGKKVIIK